jgi:hypothetical protein
MSSSVEGLDGPTVVMAKGEIGKEGKLQVGVVSVVVLVLEEEGACEEAREGEGLDLRKGLVGKLLALKQYERDDLSNFMFAHFVLWYWFSRRILTSHIWPCLGSTDQTLANVQFDHFLDSLVDIKIRENPGG